MDKQVGTVSPATGVFSVHRVILLPLLNFKTNKLESETFGLSRSDKVSSSPFPAAWQRVYSPGLKLLCSGTARQPGQQI